MVQYAIIPNQSDIDQIQRDLRFFPCTTTRPHVLTVEQIEAYNRSGYVRRLPIFSGEEMNEHRRYFDALLARVLAEGGDSYSISSAHLKYGRVYDLLKEPRIVAAVSDLLGDNVVGWGAHYFCKMPGDGKAVSWHQDCSYWPLTPSKTVTVWLAIDDADPENGCMQVLPGSHREGLLPFRTSDSNEKNVLNQTVEGVERFGAPVDIELKAGEIEIHSDLLLHGSPANLSTRRRCGLTLRYCAADVEAHLNWHLKGVIVRGTADPQRWPGAARPEQD